MFELVVAQIPPTPTLLPFATPPLTMPEFGLWEPAGTILQFWNSSGAGPGIQYVILAVLILMGIFVLIHYVRQIGGKDDA